MSTKNIIHVRSNCDLNVNYDTLKLTPFTELILVGVSPSYESNDNMDGLTKKFKTEEFIFKTTIEGMRLLVEQLTQVLEGMERIEKMTVGLNELIKEAQVEKEKPKDNPGVM